MHMIDVLEEAVGKKAVRDFQPLQAGDVPQTYANIDSIRSDLGFTPTTSIEAGIPRFVDGFKPYHQWGLASLFCPQHEGDFGRLIPSGLDYRQSDGSGDEWACSMELLCPPYHTKK